MIEGQLRGLAATPGSFKETGLNQIGLMDIFESTLVFLDCGCQRFHPNRSPSKLVDDGQKNLTIHLIKPCRIDAQPCKGILGDSLGNSSSRLDLSIVAHSFDQPVDNARSSSSPTSNFLRSIGIDWDSEHPRRACHDGLQFRRRVELQTVDEAKSVPERRGQALRPWLWPQPG